MTSRDRDPSRSVGEEEFKKRFYKAFDIDPTLTATEFYTLLENLDFNTHEAYHLVREGTKAPKSFLVPANVLDRSSPQLDANPEPKNIIVLDGSDGEDLLELHRRTQKRKKSSASRSPTKPLGNWSNSPNILFGDDDDPILKKDFREWTLPESSEDEDARPWKRPSPSKPRDVSRKTIHRPIEHSDEDGDSPSPPGLNLSRSSAKIPISSTVSSPLRSDYSESLDEVAHIGSSSDEDETSSVQDSELEEDDDDLPPLERLTSTSMPLRSKRVLKKPVRSCRNLDDDVLENRIDTKTTPWIRRLAGPLFNRTLQPAEVEWFDGEEKGALIDLTSAKGSLPHQTWDRDKSKKDFTFLGAPIRKDLENGREFYSAIELNGTQYRVGDFCLVRPDYEHAEQSNTKKRRNKPDASHEKDTNAWFARIFSLYNDEIEGEGCHLQWFIHGAQTLLEETAGPREIFDNSLCDDIPIACIVGPVKVDCIGTFKPGYYSAITETDYAGNVYFYRFKYNDSEESFTHVRDPEKCSLLKDCWICIKMEKEKNFFKAIALGKPDYSGRITAFEKEGVKYYVNDFIYMVPKTGLRYEIGQILSMKALRNSYSSRDEHREIWIKVQVLGHYDDSCRKWWNEIRNHERHAVRDNRRLYLSDREVKIEAGKVEGKCQVRHSAHIDDLDSYKDEKDTFWINSKKFENAGGRYEFSSLDAKDIRYSQETQDELAERKKTLKEFRSSTKPLRTLELFAGCGGLGLGLQDSGATVTKWAVEFAPAPAHTMKRNSPQIEVYNEDASKFLQRAMAEDKGVDTSNYKDIEGNLVSAPTPKRGEVEMIAGGFPCPGYSRCNHNPSADDIKNTLITMVLGGVDFWRPKYVLLENVPGLLSHKLGAQQGKNRLEGGIPRGTLKFIFRTLTSLGYACEFTTLQSGEYGVPQSRQRVFIWGSLGGLPMYPQPTTTWIGVRSASFHRIRVTAPHSQITIGDALTDLPAFEWVNPHNVIECSQGEKADRIQRSARIKQMAIVTGMEYVGSETQAYASPALSEYQRKLRRSVQDNELRNHVTIAFHDNPAVAKEKYIRHARTEQVCNIPMKPGADHRDLPRKLKNWGMAAAESAACRNKNYPGRIGRLDMEESFQALLTKADPGGKSGKILHPTQHRIVSVREYARAMGYPDSFQFENEKPHLAYRMIGNSVPVILAEEIGRELLELRVREFIQKKATIRENIDIEVIDLISDDDS